MINIKKRNHSSQESCVIILASEWLNEVYNVADQVVILTGGVSREEIALDPLTRKIYLELTEPSLEDNRADVDRLAAALEKLVGPVVVPLAAMRRIPTVLRDADWRVTVTVGAGAPGVWNLVDVEPGDTVKRHYGLAVDIGTTTVVVYLVNMHDGRIMGTAADYNGQVGLGEDILTRIYLAGTPGGLEQLQRAILDTLNGLIRRLTGEHGLAGREISAVAVGANSTMVHLFLGLDPSRICMAPYIPVVNNPGLIPAGQLGLEINPLAPVYCLPSVGSYVGGDVIAGVLASGLHQQPELSLFVDIGTNGEIIMGNRDWLVGCAGAAGPALEGGVAECGMRAEPGAIDSISIDPGSGKVRYTTIGGAPPVGICGSGLVDCLAELLLTGIVDRAGRFRDGRREFVVVPASESATGKDIVVTQVDINNLMRTKGAVNAALELLLESVGCDLSGISRFYAAGAFGQYLHLESAITIGLYPDLPRDKMVRLGNASGEGARLVLLSNRKRAEAESIARNITYFELNANQVFMNKFVGSKFLPHTNLDYYPTVKAKLIERGLVEG
ncbi:ferredoxin [Desulfofundulus kuznetsovii DSM 6115]|uniref:Ferredoxin n=1 Tax=Desulfofundulus kuznetsovii (strain DSM 6115 / VKM B-1805 / 17) TaxID=760568 RepID=A0AAU8PMB8_DESK7|nr:ferredoxin [Desulfofundulus kuznetsovii DSM 6115]